MSDKFFSGEMRIKGGNPARYYPAQLWNPVGSGIVVIVNVLKFHAYETDYAPTILRYETALSTLIGNGKNMILGEADSAAEIRHEETTVRPSTPPGDEIMSPINQFSNTILRLDTGIELTEGHGLIIQHDLFNKDVSYFMEWEET